MSGELSPATPIERFKIVRQERVLLDEDIAAYFERKTSHINELRQRNADLFPDSYAFELTAEEWDEMLSQSAAAKTRGGRTSLPWAYTEHGFAMLAMRMNGEKAARIARVIIDTFVQYRRGTLASGQTLPGDTGRAHRQRLQTALFQQMERLLTMEMPSGSTMSRELGTITEAAIGRVKAVLDAPAMKNAQITAEIGKLEAETAKLCAEAQQTHAATANVWADVFLKRLQILRELREMAVQLDRDAVVDDFEDGFGRLRQGAENMLSQTAAAKTTGGP